MDSLFTRLTSELFLPLFQITVYSAANQFRDRCAGDAGKLLKSAQGRAADSEHQAFAFVIRKDLYKAALFEVDKTRLPERMAQAEKAVVLRARELFYAAGDNIEEGQALDDAMYTLHALRNRPQT